MNMYFGVQYILPFLISLSSASRNDSRPYNIKETSSNSNISQLLSTDSCPAKCEVSLNPPVVHVWRSAAINETIVAATVKITIYPEYSNQTRTVLLAENLEANGYAGFMTQDKGSGRVSTTLTYGTTIDDGGSKVPITEVVIYPDSPKSSPLSYAWSGIRPTATAGTSSCLTQLVPATVGRNPYAGLAQPTSTPDSQSSNGVNVPNGISSDGTNYYLVAEPVPFQLRITNDDPVLEQCQLPSTTITAKPDEPLTTASFSTVTIWKTETKCKPDLLCEVRGVKTGIGGLLGLPNDRMTITRRPNSGNASATAPLGVIGQLGLQTVHPEKTATALNIQAPADNAAMAANSAKTLLVQPKKPQTAVDPFTFPGLGQEPPALPQITPGPQVIGSLILSGTTVPVRAVPAAPVTAEAHAERPMLVAVGSKTMTLGVAGTYGDKLVTINTVAGGATVAVIGNAQDESSQTFTLNAGGGVANDAGNGGANAAENGGAVGGGGGGGGGAEVGNVGAIYAPPPTAMPQEASRPEVTAAGVTFTPAADGGFEVAGTSLSLGGPPITIYGSSGGVATADSGASASDSVSSPTVLSLTTDTNGAEVLVINGRTSTLSTAPLQTSKAEPAQNETSNGIRPSSGFGPGTGSETTGASTSGDHADHKNSASSGYALIRWGWMYSVGISIVALASW